MEQLVTASEMKRYDANTIENIGIPGMVLMERAALEAFRVIEARFGKLTPARKRVFVLAGVGNNGGDGLALARLLCEAGYDITITCVGDIDKASIQWQMQRKILTSFPVCFCEESRVAEYNEEYDILIDALFGVGLSRAVEGAYARAIKCFNGKTGFKLALDIPSGIHSDTGEVLGCAVKADVTVTFGFVKRGLVFFPGTEYTGEIIKASIGISERSFRGQMPEMFFYDEKPEMLLPKRIANGNKGTFGKVLLVAGSSKMAGAAVLAAKAAYRAGAGMVKVISSPDNRVVIHDTVPEALYGIGEDLEESLKWADLIIIGPGIGTNEDGSKNLKTVLYKSELPLVIDADGLNLLARDEELTDELIKQCIGGRCVVLTPHVGELSGLVKLPIAELKKDLAGYGKQLAQKLHAIVVAKDATTFICREEGATCVNNCGNSGMATAGSGDVLAGIIGGLLAQGMDGFEAGAVGVYLHAKAGDNVAKEIGEHACMAGDLVKIWF